MHQLLEFLTEIPKIAEMPAQFLPKRFHAFELPPCSLVLLGVQHHADLAALLEAAGDALVAGRGSDRTTLGAG